MLKDEVERLYREEEEQWRHRRRTRSVTWREQAAIETDRRKQRNRCDYLSFKAVPNSDKTVKGNRIGLAEYSSVSVQLRAVCE